MYVLINWSIYDNDMKISRNKSKVVQEAIDLSGKGDELSLKIPVPSYFYIDSYYSAYRINSYHLLSRLCKVDILSTEDMTIERMYIWHLLNLFNENKNLAVEGVKIDNDGFIWLMIPTEGFRRYLISSCGKYVLTYGKASTTYVYRIYGSNFRKSGTILSVNYKTLQNEKEVAEYIWGIKSFYYKPDVNCFYLSLISADSNGKRKFLTNTVYCREDASESETVSFIDRTKRGEFRFKENDIKQDPLYNKYLMSDIMRI